MNRFACRYGLAALAAAMSSVSLGDGPIAMAASPTTQSAETSWPVTLAAEIEVGGLKVRPSQPPAGLKTDGTLGVLLNESMQASCLHYMAGYRADDVRAIKTPGGDYLVVVVAGEGTTGGHGHYAPADQNFKRKENDLVAYRSSDGGNTWTGPKVLFPVPYSMHGFIPLISHGSKRIYCFGTEPVPELREGRENAPIAFRYSDDDGHTWSDPTIIKPINDPNFRGMSCMQMTETDAGTWLLGSHNANWPPGSEKTSTWSMNKLAKFETRQYLLRSEDQGKTWNVVPGAQPNGWYVKDYNRMDEGRPISLGGAKVLMLARTPEGHLWELRSEDDGKTWSEPKSTTLVQPDAPPMVFFLSDKKTLVVLHHNAYDPTRPHFNGGARNQLWVSTSSDEGHTWSEPRFLMASASKDRNVQISYDDLLVDGGDLRFFVPYGWRQTLYVRMKESDLAKLPTKAELLQRMGGEKSARAD